MQWSHWKSIRQKCSILGWISWKSIKIRKKIWQNSTPSNLMCYQCNQLSCDTKQRPFQCNVLLKQVDQKKGHPINYSEHAQYIQLFPMSIYKELSVNFSVLLKVWHWLNLTENSFLCVDRWIEWRRIGSIVRGYS